MAQCTSCGAETALYVNEQPLCPSCDDQINTPPKSGVFPTPQRQTEGFRPLGSSLNPKYYL